MATRLTILGASVRAAAHSAIRAGIRPFGVDLFADRDLRSVADARRVELDRYPDVFESLVPPGQPWMYVGALENHPALIDRLAAIGPLWGNGGDVLRLVRSPFLVRDWMADEGLRTPVTLDAPPSDTTTTWLVKPLSSGGGRGIEVWGKNHPDRGTHVIQSFVEGTPASALFLGDGSTATFLGATEQLVGTPNSRFEYVGNIGPLRLTERQFDQIFRMGQALARRARLVGLFGIDLVIDGDRVWLIEVNPRYTASVELLEWSQGRSLVASHCRVFQESGVPEPPCPPPIQGVIGKAILRASVDGTFRARISPRHFESTPTRIPALTDIPDTGTGFTAGEPVMTVFARGDTADECRRRLQSKLAAWTRRLRGS